jgi:hypothetical protein
MGTMKPMNEYRKFSVNYRALIFTNFYRVQLYNISILIHRTRQANDSRPTKQNLTANLNGVSIIETF